VSRLTRDNAAVNSGVLQVAHSIFRRWRPLFRSDALFTEINHVLSKFGSPFLELLANIDQAITNHQNDKTALEADLRVLELAIQIFYDLSSQDLPPIFEDNLQAIATLLHKYLVYENPLLHNAEDDSPGPLENVKSEIFEALILYVQKYEDAFGPFLSQFVESSWTLLTTLGLETKYDLLVSRALQFLTAVAKIRSHAQAFSNETTLNQVVEKVILPNMMLRESDVEMFEDEPMEFIRGDLEGADSDSRRRAATLFLRQLMEQFEELLTQVISKYINHFLDDYAKDQNENWKSKDTAIYLFEAIAAKGVPTSAHGVKNVNSYVDVLGFFQKHIAADLTSQSVHPIVQVDAIKFIYVFRSQFDLRLWHAAFPLLVQHLNSSNYLIYTYAAIAVERALYLSTEDKQPIIPQADVVAFSKDLLTHLFKLIEKSSAPEKVQENEFLMRCVMRVLIVIKEGLLPIVDLVLRNLINITMVIRHNPSNPRFYYYHFEAIGALIHYAGPSESNKLEKALFDPFMGVLQNDVQEFMPYVFQLFAALLETNSSGVLPDSYAALIPPIIQPPLYELKGNVPALIRLLSAIMTRGTDTIISNNQLEPILGIFQKLLSTKTHETQGFELVEAVISSFPVQTLQPYFGAMVQIMLTRLSQSKTENFSLRFVRFYHFVSARDDKGLGTDFFINITDHIQQE
jgi:exportin-2 (importin alpha re-exporter)